MREERILSVLGQIDEKYVEEAAPINHETAKVEEVHKHRASRRVLPSVAVIVVLLLSSFTVAMAASEEFRNVVFNFFKLSTPDEVLPIEEEPVPSEEIENVGNTTIEDAVNVEYIRMEGKFDYKNGVVYLYDEATENFTAAYTVENKELLQLEPHREVLEYEWNAYTYEIGFDWYENEGTVHTMARNYNMDTSAAWEVYEGNGKTDFVVVVLSYGQQIEYRQYPLLYNIKTKEVFDILGTCEELKTRNITEMKFSPDWSGIIISCDGGNTAYYYNVAEKELYNLNDLCGKDESGVGAWFVDDDTLGCIKLDETGKCTCGTYVISTGEYREVFEDIPKFGYLADNGVILTGGREVLFVDEARNVFVYDFKTGERIGIDGFQYPIDYSLADKNRTGNKFLLFKDDVGAEGLGIMEMGVLDLEKKSFVLFGREGYEIREEHSIGWFDDNRIAICTYSVSEEEYGYLYLFTVEEPADNK